MPHASMQPEHVGHVVEAGLLVKGPERRADRAAGEDIAAFRPVGELDALALACERRGVVAHDRSAAQAGKADRAFPPRAGMAVADPHGSLAEIHATTFGSGAAEEQRGT